MPSAFFSCGVSLIAFRRAREHPAALGDQALVVVLPAGPRQLEQPLPLAVRRGGVGCRVDEDVAVVERGHQPGVLGAEHAVAEHVAGHVADADGREVLGLAVDAPLAEVPADRHPGAAGGDAHGLVVVAHRAAAGERIAQPEAVVLGHAVGDVGERRGALVGGDDQVGVVAVVADHAHRRHALALDEVVGDVEQSGDERAVARHAFGQPRLAVAGVGQLLAEEPALRADRHDDGVLDHLRLDESEHLGAEVVAAVGPAQATAGDRAEPQVHALDAGRVHEDLEPRSRLGQVGDGRRLHLEGHVLVRRAARGLLEVVRAQGGLDVGEVGAQDPVVVEAGHVVQRPPDPPLDLVDPRDAGLGLGVQPVLAGVEARLEQLPQLPRDVGVAAQRGLDVVDREGRVALLHVLRVRAEDGRLPPGQAGGQHEGVEAVDLVVALPDRADGVLEQAAHPVGQPTGVLQPELVDERGPLEPVELVGPLVEHLDAHGGQHRQHLRQRQP